jgi:hypothetical protein
VVPDALRDEIGAKVSPRDAIVEKVGEPTSRASDGALSALEFSPAGGDSGHLRASGLRSAAMPPFSTSVVHPSRVALRS